MNSNKVIMICVAVCCGVVEVTMFLMTLGLNFTSLEINKIIKIILPILLANILVSIFFETKIKKYKNMRKEFKKKYGYEVEKIQYYREIPNEKEATPARASYLRDYREGTTYLSNPEIGGNVFAGIVLNLSLKGFIQFEPIDKNEVKILVVSKNEELLREEELVYNYLRQAAGTKFYVTTKELKKFSRKHYSEFHSVFSVIEDITTSYYEEKGYINKETKVQSVRIKNKVELYFYIYVAILALPIFLTLPVMYVYVLRCMWILENLEKDMNKLTKEGYTEKLQWIALERYIKDYSMLDERKVPDIKLWEKYLVYATTFGISNEVVKQIKIVNPELFGVDIDYTEIGGFWNLFNFGMDGLEVLGNGLRSVYKDAIDTYKFIMSGGSDDGGSFIGRWRRFIIRRRRPAGGGGSCGGR